MKTPISKLILTALLALSASSSSAGIAVLGNLARSHTATPGADFDGIILVKNTGDTPQEVHTHQTDYLFFADGRNLYEKPVSHDRSNAEWITVSPSRIIVPPKETASIYYKGTIPEAGTLRGTYWSTIMVEPVAPAAPEIDPTKPEVGLRAVMRFAIQVATEIDGTAQYELQIADRRIARDEGTTHLEMDIANSGERLGIATVWTELFDSTGAPLGRFEGGKARIYPGCSVRFRMDLSKVPAGKYSALVVVDGGDNQVLGAQYELQLDN